MTGGKEKVDNSGHERSTDRYVTAFIWWVTTRDKKDNQKATISYGSTVPEKQQQSADMTMFSALLLTFYV